MSRHIRVLIRVLTFCCFLVMNACVDTEPNFNISLENPTYQTESMEIKDIQDFTLVESDGPNIFTTVISNDPESLDPHRSGEHISEYIMSFLGASLVIVGPEGEIEPYLAESWEISEDGLEYTFRLKKDIYFHNGVPLTAADLKYTYERAIDPETGSPAAGPQLGDVESFEAPDNYTFIINLRIPNYAFLYTISDPGYFQPMLKSWVEDAGVEIDRRPCSVGPFRLAEWNIGENLLLEANPDFNWGPEIFGSEPMNIEFMDFRIIPVEATIIAGLEAGEIDYASIETKDRRLFEELGFDILEIPQRGLKPYITINNSDPLLGDAAIRIAISKSIDRQAVLNLLEQGNGVVQYGPLSPSQIGYWPGVEGYGYSYDPDGAKRLLEESGFILNENGVYERGGRALNFTLNTISIDSWIKCAEIIQSMLRQIGIKIDIEQEEQGIIIPKVMTGEYQLAVFGMTYPEADILYQMFHSESVDGFNYAYVNDPVLDVILEQTRTTMNPEERQQAVNNAQQYITEKAFIIPLFAPNNLSVMSSRVLNYGQSPLTLHGFWLNQAIIK